MDTISTREALKKAKEISEATGRSMAHVLAVMKQRPTPEPSTASVSTAPSAPVITDHKKSKFWTTVEDYQRQNKCKITDAIRYARKLDPDSFAEYLEIANR